MITTGSFKKVIANCSGMSIIEVLIAVGVMSLVLMCTTSIFMFSSKSSEWTQSQSKVDTDVAIASQWVTTRLAMARVYSIATDVNGNTYIDFQTPVPTYNGSHEITGYDPNPKTVDPFVYRLFISNHKLYLSCTDPQVPTTLILSNVPTIDPETGAKLNMFSQGLNNKFIVIRLASSVVTANNKTVYSAITVRVTPRNLDPNAGVLHT